MDKNNAYANFGGQTKSIMVFSEVAYTIKRILTKTDKPTNINFLISLLFQSFYLFGTRKNLSLLIVSV